LARIRQGTSIVAGIVSAALAFVLVASGAAAGSAGAPRRIVSLNLCTDQILLDLVPRERIAALSELAADASLSAMAAEARGLRAIRGTAEEVLALDPDLVIAGAFTTPATVDLLKRVGRRVVTVPLASDFAGIRAATAEIAKAVGEEKRGAEIIARLDARLAAVAAGVPAERPSVVAYQVGSLASGAGSLLDQALAAAGLRNLAREKNLGALGRMSLEQLVLDPPDLVVLAHAADDFRTVLADNLRHPAFTTLIARRPSLHLPMPLWMCGTARIADAVEALAEARERLRPQLVSRSGS